MSPAAVMTPMGGCSRAGGTEPCILHVCVCVCCAHMHTLVMKASIHHSAFIQQGTSACVSVHTLKTLL